ncbi:methyltransferase, FkbM family [Dermatophilus congolensis]|uniref:Methyltransferase, FkbM family n=1 Tax=Dermatophilus congolensis TaxID=1863 RepID=A0AA46H0Y5_9MICO|nr:FkbM family methyltransferase [Dermatophilus congolensis]STD11922.1 methyltransferase, FkbM family [Dermatophilus congolensis]
MSHNLNSSTVSNSFTKGELIHLENDHIGGILHSTGNFYEVDLLDIWACIPFSEDFCFVDVGANLGNHSIYLGLSTTNKIFSLEPHPINFFLLEENIKLNGLEDRVTAKNMCAWDRKETVSLHIATAGNMGTVTASSSGPQAESQVRADKLDNIIENERVAAMKIDVEGNESRVLSGASTIINRDHPLIFIETHSPRDKRGAFSTLSKSEYSLVDFLGISDTALFAHSESPIEIGISDLNSLTSSMRERRVERLTSRIVQALQSAR